MPNPLYEDTEIAYLKTHYYGGIRKYQWGTVPLAMHAPFEITSKLDVYHTYKAFCAFYR